MKRSKAVALTTMAASVFVLTACQDDSVEAAVYRSVDHCISDGAFTLEYCESNFAQAAARHEEVAPKFTSREQCEAEFGVGQCEAGGEQVAQGGGGGFFMPMMMGYLMGSMMNRGAATQPLYPAQGGGMQTAERTSVGNNTGITNVPRTATAAPTVKTSTVSRGGFGSTATSTSQRSGSMSYGG
ncbi:DUF1190 domain-containing protein [Telmatospirillum sp. J64-1]|uniref:DUF1190 domain-containing protein n=1 Tax=Telmatospirillum sp. J64-1 TaxID=2502183 RepID=UPI00163D5AB9|nr:DUF1190 domain-containing protein [Telmatospirillum sp. J64-1]